MAQESVTMQVVTVRLDRIFDVVYQVYRGQENTLFGFQYGSKRVFGVSVRGQHALEAGAVLTVCLRTEDDWTTLVGWYNHATGATFVESAGDKVISMIVMIVIGTVWLRHVDLPAVGPMLVLLVMGAVSVGCIHSVLFTRRVRATLARLKLAPVPTLLLPPVEAEAHEADAQP
jgi:hypothetical protein